MSTQKCSELLGFETVKCIWEKYSALWIVPSFILGITIGFAFGYAIPNRFNFIESMIPEIIGIGISITGIYYLEQWRQSKLEDERLKEELLWQAKSQSNETAKSAIDRIRYKGWLTGDNGLLKGADLVEAKLQFSQLRGANLEGTYLWGANLEDARMSGVFLTAAKIDYAKLERVELYNADLSGAELRYTNLNNSRLSQAQFRKTNLFNCQFKGADLRNANLEGSHIVNARFDGASLMGAVLCNITSESKDWTDKTISATLPDGTSWSSETDTRRFTDNTHKQYQQTLQKINEVRKQLKLPELDSLGNVIE